MKEIFSFNRLRENIWSREAFSPIKHDDFYHQPSQIVFEDSQTSSSESHENNHHEEDVVVIHEHHHHHHHQDDTSSGGQSKCTINDYQDLKSLLENPVVKDFIAEYVAKEKIMNLF